MTLRAVGSSSGKVSTMKKVFCVVTLFLVSCASIAGIPFPFSDFGWDLSEKKIVDETYLKLSGVLEHRAISMSLFCGSLLS